MEFKTCTKNHAHRQELTEEKKEIKQKIADHQELEDVQELLEEIGLPKQGELNNEASNEMVPLGEKQASSNLEKQIDPVLKSRDIIFSANNAKDLVKEIPSISPEIIQTHPQIEAKITNEGINQKTIHNSQFVESMPKQSELHEFENFNDAEFISQDFSSQFQQISVKAQESPFFTTV